MEIAVRAMLGFALPPAGSSFVVVVDECEKNGAGETAEELGLASDWVI